MKRNKNYKLGFTLVELLVVISIIGLLASVVLVSLNNSRAKAHDTQIRANLAQLKEALELYYNANNSYPNTSSAWWAESSAYGSHTLSGSSGWIPNLAPSYISRLPHDKYSGVDRASFDASLCTPGTEVYYFYKSDGIDYKVDAWCIVEAKVSSTDTFYDPGGSGVSAAIYTPGAVSW